MKKMILAVAMLCGVGTAAHAQLDGGIFNHLGVGVGVGLTGIDIEVAAPITDYVQVRAGVTFMPKISISGIKMDMPSEATAEWNKHKNTILQNWGDNINYSNVTKDGQPITEADKQTVESLSRVDMPDKIEADASFKRTDFKLLFDIYPFPKRSFHVTTGFFAGTSDIININNTNCHDQLQAVTDYNNNLANHRFDYYGHTAVQFGGPIMAEFEKVEIEPNGPNVNAHLKVNGFKPYLGIGFGRAVPKKTRLAFAFDLGCQFWGKPELVVQGKKLSEDDVDEDFIKTVNKVSVYPVMTFRLCGKIL